MNKTCQFLFSRLYAPQLYASCKEALYVQVRTVLWFEGISFDKYIEEYLGYNCALSLHSFDNEWAQRLVKRAIDLLIEEKGIEITRE